MVNKCWNAYTKSRHALDVLLNGVILQIILGIWDLGEIQAIMSTVHLTTLTIPWLFFAKSWKLHGKLVTWQLKRPFTTQGEGWNNSNHIWGKGGGEKTRAKKNMSGVFCVLNIFQLWCLRIRLVQFEKTGWVLTKTSSRSIVLHRCLQLFVRFLGIWNKWCDIIDTISISAITHKRFRGMQACTNHSTLPLVGGLGVWKTSVFELRFQCVVLFGVERSKRLLLQMQFWAPDIAWSYVFTMDSQISSEFPVHESRKAICLYW